MEKFYNYSEYSEKINEARGKNPYNFLKMTQDVVQDMYKELKTMNNNITEEELENLEEDFESIKDIVLDLAKKTKNRNVQYIYGGLNSIIDNIINELHYKTIE